MRKRLLSSLLLLAFVVPMMIAQTTLVNKVDTKLTKGQLLELTKSTTLTKAQAFEAGILKPNRSNAVRPNVSRIQTEDGKTLIAFNLFDGSWETMSYTLASFNSEDPSDITPIGDVWTTSSLSAGFFYDGYIYGYDHISSSSG